MIIGYARARTIDQSVDMQLNAMKEYGCEEIDQEIFAGTKGDRTELLRAIKRLRTRDKVAVYKVDRLARSTKRLIETAELFREKGVEFVSIQNNIDTGASEGKARFGMLAVLAEFQRDTVRERTMVGLKAARARGRKGGRPKVNQQKLDQAIALYHSQRMSVKEIQEATGISAATLYREVKKERVFQVSRLIFMKKLIIEQKK